MSTRAVGRWILKASVICFSTLSGVAQAPNRQVAIHDSQSQIVGTWRGTSECAVKSSPCHDEINVYRFSKIPARPGWFSGTGSKIVDGKEISMGTLNWSYDATSHALRSESSSATFQLFVEGNKIDGNLTLSDKTVYRRIHLEKEN
jgi:hypothetical protein